MRKTKVLITTCLLLLTVNGYALDPIPEKPGFNGFIRAGGGVLDYKSNQVAGNKFMDVGTDVISSLTDEPDSDTSGLAVFNFELSYTLSGSRTQLTLGSQLEDVARLDISQQLAVKHELPDKSIISVCYLFTGIPSEVWEDPYVTGTPRQETDRTSMGGRFVYDRILGSNFEFRYSYRNIDIDDEKSGVTLGLVQSQRDLLRRDGDNHALTLSYRFDIEKRHRLVPEFRFFYQDRDGDAMSNQGGDFQLTYFFFNDPVTLLLNGVFGMADYDETNPLYGKTREDDRYAFGIQIYHKNPFGWKPFGQEDFSVFAAAGYLLEDANIDFYDTEVTTVQAGVLWRF